MKGTRLFLPLCLAFLGASPAWAQPADPAASGLSAQPIESVQPADPAQPVETVQPGPTALPADVPQPAEVPLPVGVPQPAEVPPPVEVAQPPLPAPTDDTADGLAWGIGTAETVMWATMAWVFYGNVSDTWLDLTLYGGGSLACLAGAGVGVAAHVNQWAPWAGRAIHGVGTGLGEALVLGAMAQEGGDETWGRLTPEVWGMAGAFAVASGTASALGIDSYQEFLTVAAFQGGGLMAGALGGAVYKIIQSMCTGDDCSTENEAISTFMTVVFAGMLVGHVTGLALVSVKSPQSEPAPALEARSLWERVVLTPVSPTFEGAGITATLAW